MQDQLITLRLPANTVGQIIDGLTQRMLVWQATAEYLQRGRTDITDTIEECSDAQEAQALADWYQQIIQEITRQRNAQVIRPPHQIS
ncbi:MAG TPA: hypothetical protein P5279_01515 [Anaerohalosphaeraceae bacterium]|jgi:hypothetical protein|nr:hypothetical protein [Anaerohalosphaeraceae bacterium]HRT49146.1 hypothetical protein [Anaerohalosphaeraceae bacterium]HRT87779.1 hypothetical protein [Anaerohalosphaeraceae bacterium]